MQLPVENHARATRKHSIVRCLPVFFYKIVKTRKIVIVSLEIIGKTNYSFSRNALKFLKT